MKGRKGIPVTEEQKATHNQRVAAEAAQVWERRARNMMKQAEATDYTKRGKRAVVEVTTEVTGE